nr:eukaryotic translation initiation factor 2 subunit gamma-like [Hydra vulgaris]
MADSETFIDINEIMHNQPVINVGMIGHVTNGKSTIVKGLTDKTTQQFSKEKERNITICLGYANAKIWRCNMCKSPQNFSASDSTVMLKRCNMCGSNLDLVIHISFVDCPGHNELTTTMLNGSSVMDYAVLVEACDSQVVPSPQTAEHFVATRLSNIPTCMVIMNKIDLVKKEEAKKQINSISEYIKKMYEPGFEKLTPIIPVSATLGINFDVICQCLSQLVVLDSRNRNAHLLMIVIRSFDVNKPGIDVSKLKGGVIGGTIKQGTLKVKDKILIYPGMVKKIPDSDKKDQGADFYYKPIKSDVLSIKSETNNLNFAIPGGLLGIQLTVDPAFTRSNYLSGSIVIKDTDTDTKLKVYDKIIIEIKKFLYSYEKANKLLKKKQELMINVNSNNIDCVVYKYNKSKQELYLTLLQPVVIDSLNNSVIVINKNTCSDIIGCGAIIDGIECELFSI